MKRRVFFISDRTGITAETLGASLLTQFPDIEFQRNHIPFVTTPLAAEARSPRSVAPPPEPGAAAGIQHPDRPGRPAHHRRQQSLRVRPFGTFIEPLEAALGCASSHTAGRMHGIGDVHTYERRVHALNFTLGHDDGLSPGISTRPTSCCSAYPAAAKRRPASTSPCITRCVPRLSADGRRSPDGKLPRVLHACDKLYGLTIVPEQLSRIRRERRPHGEYATLPRCRTEVHQAEALFRAENIPYLDTTTVSIEEIAATIVRDMGLH